jgi:hypothetical protein
MKNMLAILEATCSGWGFTARWFRTHTHTLFTPPCLTEYNLGFETISSDQGTDLLATLTVPQPVKQNPTFYATQQFNTVFTRNHNLSLTLASRMRSMPSNSTALISILISSTRLC